MFLAKQDILSDDFLKKIITFPDVGKADELAEIKQLVQEAHIELRLGEEAFITKEQVPKRLSQKDSFLAIPPGEFALLTTYEKIKIPPDLTAFISIKFTYKVLGLVNISGFHVDPGFKGKIIFSVYNVGPIDIILRYRDPVFIIFFAQLSQEVERPRGDRPEQITLPLNAVTSLRGAGMSLTALEKRVSRLETILYIVGGVFVSLLAVIVTILVRFQPK